jgi:hypothetical protein
MRTTLFVRLYGAQTVFGSTVVSTSSFIVVDDQHQAMMHISAVITCGQRFMRVPLFVAIR